MSLNMNDRIIDILFIGKNNAGKNNSLQNNHPRKL